MLVGCLIKHFKIYENVVFTPVTLGCEGSLSIFTGNNGVGKSSILEAINHFFNDTGWLINNRAKKQDAYVAPIFLIKKDEFNSDIDKSILEAVSEYFWNVSESANPTIAKNDSIKEFLNYRDSIKDNFDTDSYYIFLVGRKYPSITNHFATFDSDIKNHVLNLGYNPDDLGKLYKSILDHYAYVYIPVESSTQDVLKLESQELQELMDKDVLDEIDSILNRKLKIPREALGLDRGPKEVNFSPLKHINDSLDKFIDEANRSIQKLGEKYSFSTERNQKKSLSVQDIRDRILEEYFSIRALRKDNKLIENLSSGEQRIALFDIAYSLLSQGKRTKKNLILAIDEPEASMHMSQCYRQFIRLSEISKKFGHQVLITTHWYGFLPVLDVGYINHIDHSNGIKITQHPLKSVTSEQKTLPEDISLKSMFDLVSSVIGMMRSETVNWIVCEGVDDQFYLKEFLGEKIDNLCVLPMGGIDNVVKLYNYLYTPLKEKPEERSVSGKVVCITDTDYRPVYPTNHISLKNNLLTLRRLQLHKGEFELVELNKNSTRYVTVIEDLLDARLFFESITCVINNYGDESLKSLIKKMKVADGAIYSGFSKDLDSIEGLDMESHKRKSEIVDFVSRHDIKYKIAESYVTKFNESGLGSPEWAESIIELFNKTKKSTNKSSQGTQQSCTPA
ncbi:AAA family ATPase [Microbulbifer thermotolerans]|uniref:AAA family ATPase n=1 Tax=Microbulbifer thermotolerans TaxID=252514 RepID=UPI00224B9EFD|nr:AAA family ATPase [Microbulbifer thermotolerans]MCX2833825.1 AAA family ATPase [Microbulbifer thermotolerans]